MRTGIAQLIGLALLLSFAHPARGANSGSPIPSALKQASLDGRPVLALGTRADCSRCAAFKKRLATEPSLRLLVSNYVVVNFDVDSPTGGIIDLAQRKNLSGELPFVYLLRSNGELLAASADIDLDGPFDKMLKDGLAGTSRLLPATEAARHAAALTKANQACERGDFGQAIAMLAPALKATRYADVVVQSQRLQDKIKEQATRDIAEAERLLGQPAQLLPAAVLITDAKHKYAKLPEQSKKLGALVRKAGQQPDGRTVLSQAELIVKARGLARAKKNDRAAEAFGQIIEKYPGTAIATLAATERDALAKVDSAKPVSKDAKKETKGLREPKK